MVDIFYKIYITKYIFKFINVYIFVKLIIIGDRKVEMIEREKQQTERQAWQDVCKEFRTIIGEVNETKYYKLFQLIAIWGEQLASLRLLHPEYIGASIEDHRRVIGA